MIHHLEFIKLLNRERSKRRLTHLIVSPVVYGLEEIGEAASETAS